ncbi:GGDEF domain-containing protein [Marinobacter sp. V034]|uniref:GGDEF domain-containing protein n=1 Tax=Marinobacter sp. V034 TaxID=3459610 RepID=UPI004043EA94
MTQPQQLRVDQSRAEEDVRVAKVLTYLSVSGVVCLAGIGIKSWFSAHPVHAVVLILFMLLVLLNMAAFRRSGNFAQQKNGLLTIVGGLFAYLIASGGESNTGPLWLYVFPPLVFYLTSLRAGSLLLGLYLAFCLLVFMSPDLPFVTGTYAPDFKLRFIVTLMFESIFCFVLEASRRRARNQLVKLANSHEQAARTDELTGLPNRRDMHLQLNNELARYQRSGRHFSAVLIDLDHFKRINDEFGHDAGDQALQEFADLLRGACRESDTASRWGGEEFLILLPDTSLLQALTLTERLRSEVEEHDFIYHSKRLPVTISAGVCSITQSDSINGLLRLADKNLYDAKEAGRNRISPRVRSKIPSGSR